MKKVRKHVSILFLFVFLLLGLKGTAGASKGGPAGEGREIVVGYTLYDQTIHKGKDGEFYGYGVSYLKEIAKYTGWTYRFELVRDDQRIQDLADQKIDLLCDVQRNCDGNERLLFSQERSTLEYGVLWALEDNESIYYDDFEAMNGKRIGINMHTGLEPLLQQYAEKNGIAYQPVYYDTFEYMALALRSGEIDMVLASSLRSMDDVKYVAKAGMTDEYFTMSGNQKDLMEELDNAMDSILMKQPFFDGGLYQNFYGSPSVKLQGITREEHEFIDESKPVKVVCDAVSYPLEYENDAGKYDGIYADALALISKESGLQFEFIMVDDFSKAAEMLEKGEADLITGCYGEGVQRRDDPLTYSDSYMTSEYTLVCSQNLEHLVNPTIALPKNYTGVQRYFSENHPEWPIVLYDSVEMCLRAVEAGEVEVTSVNSVFLQTVYNLDNYDGVVLAPGMVDFIPISLGIGQNDSGMLENILNKAISGIPEDAFSRCVVENAINISYKVTFGQMLRVSLPYLLVLLVFVFIICFFTVRRRERHYHYLAVTDSITGLWNADKFKTETGRLLNRNKDKEYVIISMDVERFKYINNDFGSAAGNTVLKVVGQRIKKSFGEDVMCCRLMADIFVILTEPARDLQEKLYPLGKEIYIEKNHKKHYCKVQLKFGLCVIRAGERAADLSLYTDRASVARKSVKGNAILHAAYYDEEMDRTIKNELLIEQRMEQALKNREFQVYYQAKYDLKTEEIIGAEALVRWIMPEKGIVPPDDFIPIFEKNGFIVDLDFYVYEEVLRQMTRWKQEERKLLCISVNVSRIHVGASNFLERLSGLLEQYHIEKKRFELELTETILGEEQKQTRQFIRDCKEAGFPVSIDDFGSGYSSLNLLKELPVDILKIDKAFLDESENSVRSSIIVQQVVEMAKKINIGTLCEGVETPKQAKFLKEIGCDMAQGYLFSRPLPKEEFEKLL